MKPVKKTFVTHISLDLFFLTSKNSLEIGVIYDQDYWPNNAVGAEWICFSRDDSRHTQAK